MTIIHNAKVFVQFNEIPESGKPIPLHIEGLDGKMIHAGFLRNENGYPHKAGDIRGINCTIEYVASTNKKLQSCLQLRDAEVVSGAVSISRQSDHPDFAYFAPEFEPTVLTEEALNGYLDHIRLYNPAQQVLVIFGTEASDDYENGNLKSSHIKESHEEYFFASKEARDAFIIGMNVAEGWDRRVELTGTEELAEMRAVLTKKTPKPR